MTIKCERKVIPFHHPLPDGMRVFIFNPLAVISSESSHWVAVPAASLGLNRPPEIV